MSNRIRHTACDESLFHQTLVLCDALRFELSWTHNRRLLRVERETEINMGKKNIGSSFDDFLKEEAMLDGATAIALKRMIAWQIAEEMKTQRLTKTELAKRMRTSRASLNRLLDEEDTSLTLTTLASAAAALGKRINFQLAAAASDRQHRAHP